MGSIIDHTLKGRDIHCEQIYVADEMGVQGWFQQPVGHVLGSVCEAQHQDIRFGDFKSADRNYHKTADVAIVSRTIPTSLPAVGELKVPWVEDHKLNP
ncbi:hypothetical protein N7491_008925 [Penicillium cf. griseofulvum]|nr:hypothetical protein N7491_008925 [Penicillium cf. griseofulvum]KAJ5431037.1 hypothetical protein N7445_008769 [Penicillium cf. griseofulvum]